MVFASSKIHQVVERLVFWWDLHLNIFFETFSRMSEFGVIEEAIDKGFSLSSLCGIVCSGFWFFIRNCLVYISILRINPDLQSVCHLNIRRYIHHHSQHFCLSSVTYLAQSFFDDLS